MHPDPPAPGGDASRRLRRLLVWSGLTLLVAMTLALAIVIASLALNSAPSRDLSGRRA